MGGAGHWQSAIVVVKCFIDYTFGRFLQAMTGTVAFFSRKILSLEVSILKDKWPFQYDPQGVFKALSYTMADRLTQIWIYVATEVYEG